MLPGSLADATMQPLKQMQEWQRTQSRKTSCIISTAWHLSRRILLCAYSSLDEGGEKGGEGRGGVGMVLWQCICRHLSQEDAEAVGCQYKHELMFILAAVSSYTQVDPVDQTIESGQGRHPWQARGQQEGRQLLR